MQKFHSLITRFSRNRHGGGIAIYVKGNIVVETLLHGPSDLEFIC